MKRLFVALMMVTACKHEKAEKPADQPPAPSMPSPPAPVAVDAAPAAEAIDAGPYRMKKQMETEAVKIDPLPPGWMRDDSEITYKVPSTEVEITISIEAMRFAPSDADKPDVWVAAEAKDMVAKVTKTEKVGAVTIANFKADQEWFWAYANLNGTVWRCGTNLQETDKTPAVKAAVATARTICASMHS